MTALKRLSRAEFIALMAMIFATIAMSIDAMLPALPEIAASMTPDDPNRAQLVVGTFFIGMAIGTIFGGPLSDAYGRKPIMILGCVIYAIAAIVCYFAESFELFLLARVVQGIGASGPRTVSMAMVRDLYSGRDMAQIMSITMMIFMIFPAIAPLMGQFVMVFAGWHAIFLVLVGVAVIASLWLGLRQPETLPADKRKPISVKGLIDAGRDLFVRPVIWLAIVIQGLTMGTMMASISSVQGVFEQYYNDADNFPLWFALIAGVSAFGSLLNSKLVMRLGMRRVASGAYMAALAICAANLALRLFVPLGPLVDFTLFMVLVISLFAMMGLTMGNLNALAMEPVGHIAGFASSMIGSVSTLFAVIFSVPIGLAFNGTPVPLSIGATVLTFASVVLMRFLKK